MRAIGLAGPQPTLRVDAPAAEAADLLRRAETSAILVVDEAGRVVGVVSDEDLLRELLPDYVEEADALARVLGEAASEELSKRLASRTVGDLLSRDRADAVVDGDATLVEVAAVMVRARVRLVGVVVDGALVGGITIDHLLSHLATRR